MIFSTKKKKKKHTILLVCLSWAVLAEITMTTFGLADSGHEAAGLTQLCSGFHWQGTSESSGSYYLEISRNIKRCGRLANKRIVWWLKSWLTILLDSLAEVQPMGPLVFSRNDKFIQLKQAKNQTKGNSIQSLCAIHIQDRLFFVTPGSAGFLESPQHSDFSFGR